MITQLILDTTPCGKKVVLRKGLPVLFVGWDRTKMPLILHIKTPDGEVLRVSASAVGSHIDEPEETVVVLAEALGLGYDALVKACREGRVLARKSGGTWLTTRNAVEYALVKGTIRKKVGA